MSKSKDTVETLLLRAGVGPLAASEAAGIGRSTLWRWMSGVSSPRIAQLAALAQWLDLPPETVASAVARSAAVSRRRRKRLPAVTGNAR